LAQSGNGRVPRVKTIDVRICQQRLKQLVYAAAYLQAHALYYREIWQSLQEFGERLADDRLPVTARSRINSRNRATPPGAFAMCPNLERNKDE
jgi:hypothetical protein